MKCPWCDQETEQVAGHRVEGDQVKACPQIDMVIQSPKYPDRREPQGT